MEWDEHTGEMVEVEDDTIPSLATKIREMAQNAPKNTFNPPKLKIEVKTLPHLSMETSLPAKHRHQLTPNERVWGGHKGGTARKKNLSPEKRREIAKKAAIVRWSKLSGRWPLPKKFE
jgi:hypothetical protein